MAHLHHQWYSSIINRSTNEKTYCRCIKYFSDCFLYTSTFVKTATELTSKVDGTTLQLRIFHERVAQLHKHVTLSSSAAIQVKVNHFSFLIYLFLFPVRYVTSFYQYVIILNVELRILSSGGATGWRKESPLLLRKYVNRTFSHFGKNLHEIFSHLQYSPSWKRMRPRFLQFERKFLSSERKPPSFSPSLQRKSLSKMIFPIVFSLLFLICNENSKLLCFICLDKIAKNCHQSLLWLTFEKNSFSFSVNIKLLLCLCRIIQLI